MNNSFKIVFLITFIFSLITNSVSVLDFMLYVIAMIVAYGIFIKYLFSSNWGKYLVFFFVWISVIMIPAFHLVRHLDQDYSNYYASQLDYNRILSFGIHLFFIVSISLFVFGKFTKKKIPKGNGYLPMVIKNRYVVFLFIVTYVLTFFSYVTGISRMGAEGVQLPFHLSGIINLYRLSLFPLIFAVIIENFILNGMKIPRKYYAVYFLWVILEVFTWMSKGIIIELLLPLSLVLILYYRPTVKQVIKVAAPILVIFVLLYPIIGIMRYMESGSLSELISSAQAAKAEADSKVDEPFVLLTILNRVFMTGFQYGVDYNYINHDQLFDFSRLPMLFIYRGAQGYQTHFIDGFADDAINSSGTTGIMDPLLHGGYGLCYIVVCLLMLVASLVDNIFKKRQYSIYVIGLLVVWTLCGSNVSTMYDPIGLQYLFVYFIGAVIAFQVNFRNKRQQKHNHLIVNIDAHTTSD